MVGAEVGVGIGVGVGVVVVVLINKKYIKYILNIYLYISIYLLTYNTTLLLLLLPP